MRLEFKIRKPQHMAACDYPRIRVGALRLLSRQHYNSVLTGNWNIASWHWQNSTTWSWILALHPLEWRGYWLPKNNGVEAAFGPFRFTKK